MKKIPIFLYLAICFMFMFATFLLPVDASEMILNMLCKCKTATFIYEESNSASDVLEEKKDGDPVYVITPGTTYSEVFCNGKKGYILTEKLAPMNLEDIASDEAFDTQKMILENEEILRKVYEKKSAGTNVAKTVVIATAVGVVILFVLVDLIVKRKKASDAEDNTDV